MGTPADAALLSWANTTCADAPFGWGVGFSVTNEALTAGGREDRIPFLTTMLQDGLKVVLDGGALDQVFDQEKLQSYTFKLGSRMLPGVILAGLMVIAWLPLWISRCCAHRCCPPKYGEYSTQKKRHTFCCCSVWWLLLALSIGLGCAASAEAFAHVRTLLCGVNTLLDDMVTMTGSISTTLVSLDQNVTGVSTALTAVTSDLDALVAALALPGEAPPLSPSLPLARPPRHWRARQPPPPPPPPPSLPGGAVKLACDGVTSAAATLDDVDTLVVSMMADASQPASSSPTRSADFLAVKSSLGDGKTLACTTVRDAKPQVDDAQTSVGSIRSPISTLLAPPSSPPSTPSPLSSVVTSLSGADNSLKIGRADVLRPLRDTFWDPTTQLGPIVGNWQMIVGIVPLLLIGALGVLCACRRRKKPSCCTCNEWGVQLAGIAWVISSVNLVFLFLFGAILLVLATGVTDLVYIANRMPHEPAKYLGARTCAPFDMGTLGSIEPCALASNCFGGTVSAPIEPVPLSATIMQQLGLTDFNEAFINSKIAQARTALDSNSLSIDTSKLTDLTSAGGDAAINDATFLSAQPGLSSHARWPDVQAKLASVRSDVTDAVSRLGTPISTLSSLKTNGNALLTAAAPLSKATTALDGPTNCSWVKPAWKGVMGPLDDVWKATGAIGLAFLLGGGFSLLWMISLIYAQVRLGHVGRAPCGCCPGCCCPSLKHPKPTKLMRQMTDELPPGALHYTATKTDAGPALERV